MTTDFFHDLDESLRRENMLEILQEKAKLLSSAERRRLGEQLIDLADNYGVKYLSLTLPPHPDDDDDKPSLYLFPSQTYRPSLLALAEVLTKSCNCSNPELSHKQCTVNVEYEYSTTDAWFMEASSDNILSTPQRIRELADGLECPYQLLLDEERSIEIIDWVDTAERLGWEPPPQRRHHFVETMTYEPLKDEFDQNDDVYTLFNKYVTGVKSETDERKKVKLLNRAVSMLRELGTNDGYISIYTKGQYKRMTYFIPYLANKASINLLHKALKKEADIHTVTKGKMWEKRCRCGIISAAKLDTKIVHEGYLYKKITSKRELDTRRKENPDIGIIKNLVDADTLGKLLLTGCPYTILDNIGEILLS